MSNLWIELFRFFQKIFFLSSNSPVLARWLDLDALFALLTSLLMQSTSRTCNPAIHELQSGTFLWMEPKSKHCLPLSLTHWLTLVFWACFTQLWLMRMVNWWNGKWAMLAILWQCWQCCGNVGNVGWHGKWAMKVSRKRVAVLLNFVQMRGGGCPNFLSSFHKCIFGQ